MEYRDEFDGVGICPFKCRGVCEDQKAQTTMDRREEYGKPILEICIYGADHSLCYCRYDDHGYLAMQYLYHKDASSSSLQITGDEHRYIFKVRRSKVGDIIHLRNLKDQILYSYEVLEIDKKRAILHLTSQRELHIKAERSLHIGWCKIDPKSIEKMLPTLNEIGVDKITFIDCQRSQNNFRIDFKRLDKILLNSSQQCGRSSMMTLEQSTSLDTFIKDYPQSYMLNFSDNIIDDHSQIDTIIIGAEGGFTDKESRLIDSDHTIALDTPLILKSESAVASIASKIVL